MIVPDSADVTKADRKSLLLQRWRAGYRNWICRNGCVTKGKISNICLWVGITGMFWKQTEVF